MQNFRFLRLRFGVILLLVQHIRTGVKTCLAMHKARKNSTIRAGSWSKNDLLLQNAEVLEQDLRAEQDEDHAAGQLGLALVAQAEHVAEPDAGRGKDEGDRADERHGGDDARAGQERERDADGRARRCSWRRRAEAWP